MRAVGLQAGELAESVRKLIALRLGKDLRQGREQCHLFPRVVMFQDVFQRLFLIQQRNQSRGGDSAAAQFGKSQTQLACQLLNALMLGGVNPRRPLVWQLLARTIGQQVALFQFDMLDQPFAVGIQQACGACPRARDQRSLVAGEQLRERRMLIGQRGKGIKTQHGPQPKP